MDSTGSSWILSQHRWISHWHPAGIISSCVKATCHDNIIGGFSKIGVPEVLSIPDAPMYGIFTYIYPKNGPNVGKYSIHGAYGYKRIFHYKPSSYWGTTNLGNPHLVGGDWNHGILNDFPYIYILGMSFHPNWLSLHHFSEVYHKNQSTSHNPGFAKSNPLFSTMLQRFNREKKARPWVFRTIPGDGGEGSSELCWWINPGATLLFLHLVTPGCGSKLKAIDWGIFRIW